MECYRRDPMSWDVTVEFAISPTSTTWFFLKVWRFLVAANADFDS
jgi:hypothetical protein